MEYLKRRDEANRLLRSSLRIAVPWARSVIVCAANYNADAPKSIDPAPPETGWIARYAWTGYQDAGQPSDYHDVLLARLKTAGAEPAAGARPLSIPLLRGHGSPGRARLRQVRRHWLDRKKHLHPRPAARIVAFSGRDSHRAGAAVRRPFRWRKIAAAVARDASMPAPPAP